MEKVLVYQPKIGRVYTRKVATESTDNKEAKLDPVDEVINQKEAAN